MLMHAAHNMLVQELSRLISLGKENVKKRKRVSSNDFRTGQRTKLGLLMDGKNSAIRYYKNNFCDGYRQVNEKRAALKI